MQLDRETLDSARELVKTPSLWLPTALLVALAGRVDFAKVRASLDDVQEEGPLTDWRALVLTDRALVYVDLSVPSGEERPDVDGAIRCSAWTRPLVDISSISGTDLHPSQDPMSNFRRWRWATRVTFRDGTEVDVPLFGDVHPQRDEDRVEGFLSCLQERWPTS